MERTRMVRGLPFPAVLPETRMTRAEAQRAIDDMRAEAVNLPEISGIFRIVILLLPRLK